ncbi:MAG: hypothetical protein Gaeavirus18_7 [Gaeavirus sp.]|uniref:Uncharacterized protein n=1 Tax=Gaeavirus sp. TaxID=2487767 RepID=A0A3G4ZZD8_9VIRU|nr:MAG: hypothetical protein Gaeavirus18_7 [Gaeavirus sp.]
MDYTNQQLQNYVTLSNKYIIILTELLDFAAQKKLLPATALLGLSFMKQYINNSRTELIQLGITHILPNKTDILNFSISNISNLNISNDSDNDDDNISIHKYIKSFDDGKQQKILNMVLDIQHKAKHIHPNDTHIIKSYIELIIIILEKIQIIFSKPKLNREFI